MTKTQIWLAGFLAVFFLLLVLGRLFKNDSDSKPKTSGNMMSQQQSAEQGDLSAEELINKFACAGCHGAGLSGGPNGPALAGLKTEWSRDNLINYLRNPNSFMDKDKFKAYRGKYSNTLMPPFNNVDIKDLGKIADYLLTK